MDYILRNVHFVTIRKPTVDDAEAIINVIKNADKESPYLARNPGEFQATVEEERNIIADVLNSTDSTWFVAEYEGEVVGQCYVGLVRSNQRYRHRAKVAFVLLEQYCNMGIGGKMMEECLNWCREHNVTQVELTVIKNNERAFRMYKNFGFEIIGTIPNSLRYPDGSYADEYIMVKFL